MSNEFDTGCQKFEEHEYESAIQHWINAYEMGEYRTEIEQILWDCFITPNEKEFQDAYAKNNQQVSQLTYEELPIVFLCVAENTYYLFDTETKQFLGKFEDCGIGCKTEEVEFDSLMIADTWDIRNCIPYLQEKRYSTVYWCLDEYERYFLSFLKLPLFFEKYMQNMVVFPSKELMKLYFDTYPEFYLPKKILAEKRQEYQMLFDKIHERRLQKQGPEEVFLSICIPSYNRGELLLKSVENILCSNYDSEIEIVVSNNGSKENTAGYETVKNKKDSRIHYHEFAEDQGAVSNIRKVIGLAKGKFIILASDEDTMIIEELPNYLKHLLNYPVSLTVGGGYGFNLYNGERQVHDAGLDAYNTAINLNYMTGITFQAEALKRNRVLERFDEMRGNVFLEFYPHITLALMSCERASVCLSDVKLWKAVDNQEVGDEGEKVILQYMQYESRVEQMDSCVELVCKNDNYTLWEKVQLFVGRIYKTYYLLYICYFTRAKSYRTLHHWIDMCHELHVHNISLLHQYDDLFDGKLLCMIEDKMKEAFWQYAPKDPDEPVISKSENAREQISLLVLRVLYEDGKKIENVDFGNLQREVDKFINEVKNV